MDMTILYIILYYGDAFYKHIVRSCLLGCTEVSRSNCTGGFYWKMTALPNRDDSAPANAPDISQPSEDKVEVKKEPEAKPGVIAAFEVRGSWHEQIGL